MSEWIANVLAAAQPSLALLPAVALVGLFGAVGSCCNMGVIASVAGYSGATSDEAGARNGRIMALTFVGGTVVALTALGIISGLIGQQPGTRLGYWWALFAGLVMIVFGLAALDWLPVQLPAVAKRRTFVGSSRAGAAPFGLALGGGQVPCSSACACNPALVVALGFALQGDHVWGASVMAAYAVGYSLPLGAVLGGMRFGVGRLTKWRDSLLPAFRKVGGIALLGVGFYMLIATGQRGG